MIVSFAHPFEFLARGNAQRKQPENHCKTRWISKVASTGVGGDASQVDTTSSDLDEEEHIQGFQPD
jgi:hypothetical protein